MTLTKNEVLLEGTRTDMPVPSHENHGTRFYRFFLQVPRLSGTPDLLPVVLPEQMLPQALANREMQVQGQLRSFNNRSGIGNKLVLTVYARALHPGSGEPRNQITLTGSLCKPPIFRRTPLGRSICDLMLAVPRRYGRADYLPVIAWGQLAAETCELQVGDTISLDGRIQSRTYHKILESGCGEERVAYEVSIMHLL